MKTHKAFYVMNRRKKVKKKKWHQKLLRQLQRVESFRQEVDHEKNTVDRLNVKRTRFNGEPCDALLGQSSEQRSDGKPGRRAGSCKFWHLQTCFCSFPVTTVIVTPPPRPSPPPRRRKFRANAFTTTSPATHQLSRWLRAANWSDKK